MKKIICAILIGMIFMLSFTACAKKDEDKGGPIAIIVPSASHGWMAGIAYFAKQKCEELNLSEGDGYKLLTSSNVNEQANQIEEMINLKCSAIVLLPHTDEVSVTAQKIIDADIPLIIFDRKVASDYTAYFAGDNTGIGSHSAEYLGEQLNGSGTIAILNVPSSGSVSTERVNAFKDVMSDNYPNIDLIDMAAPDFTQQSGLKTLSDVLVANDKIDAIFSIDDESSIGMLQAIKDAKRTDVKYITGAGGSQNYFTKIAESEQPICITATYSPSMIKDAVQAAVDIKNGKEVKKDNIIPPTIVTKDNVSNLLDANSPY